MAKNKPNASFYYCEDHINQGWSSVYDYVGQDDGEAVCMRHHTAFDELTDHVAHQYFQDQDISVLTDDRDQRRFREEMTRQIRIWRWQHYHKINKRQQRRQRQQSFELQQSFVPLVKHMRSWLLFHSF